MKPKQQSINYIMIALLYQSVNEAEATMHHLCNYFFT